MIVYTLHILMIGSHILVARLVGMHELVTIRVNPDRVTEQPVSFC